MDTISTNSLEIIVGSDEHRIPELKVHRRSGFLILELRWNEAIVESVRFDGIDIEAPLSNNSLHGAYSFWQLPYNLYGFLVVKGRHIDGKQVICEASLDPLADTDYTHHVNVRIFPEPSIGHVPWGYHAQTLVELVSAAEGKDANKLPSRVLACEWSIVRGTRMPLTRQFAELDQNIRGAVVQIDEIISDIYAEWEKRTGGKQMSSDDLMQELLDRCQEMEFLTEDGIRQLTKVLNEVHASGYSMIQQLHIKYGEDYASLAIEKWLDAASSIVAKSLDLDMLESAGLAPSTRTERLNSLIFSDQDEIKLYSVPDELLIDLELPDGSRRPSKLATIRVRNGEIEWDDSVALRSEFELSQFVQNHEMNWVSEVTNALEKQPFDIGKSYYDDLKILEKYEDTPGWFYESIDLYGDTLINSSDLLEKQMWLDLKLPSLLKSRLFSYLLQQVAHSGAYKQGLCKLTKSDGVFDSLSQIDKFLMADNRYDRVLHELAQKLGVYATSLPVGRYSILLFVMGFGDATQTIKDEFVESLIAADTAQATKIAREYLLSGEIKAVNL